MDVVSSNLSNAQTTRATINENGDYEAYRRKMVTLEPKDTSFQSFLHKASNHSETGPGGVKVTNIIEDETPFKQYIILPILMLMKKDMYNFQMLIRLKKWLI